jgi:threonine aldolase
MFTAEQVKANINNRADVHLPNTSLVCTEDTVNKGGGAIWDFNEILKIQEVCKANGMALHCDGARLFNALEETKMTPAEYAKAYDSISVCLSKGLSAPVGSFLVGSKEFILKARRRRKSMGGGMRQAGFLAAAGLHAMKVERFRLHEDHAHAKAIGNVLSSVAYCAEIMPVETNIVIWRPTSNSSAEMIEKLNAVGIKCFPFGPVWLRFVFHRNVSAEQVQELKDKLMNL